MDKIILKDKTEFEIADAVDTASNCIVFEYDGSGI